MKRLLAAALAAFMLVSAPSVAEEGGSSATVDKSAYGVIIMKNREERSTSKQTIAIDYPTFECDDAELQKFLNDSVTLPILALRKLGQMSEEAAYSDGATDMITGAYYASMDFDSILSVEATVGNRAAGADASETSLFYRMIDLKTRRVLTVDELFEQSAAEVSAALRGIVYEKAQSQGILKPDIKSADDVPDPNSYYVCAEYFRTIFASGTINDNAIVFNIPWDTLPLTPSALLSPASSPSLESTDTPAGDTEKLDDEIDAPDGAEANGEDDTDDTEETTAPPDNGSQDNASTETLEPKRETLDPNYTLPPVATPTPMPLAGGDALMVDVLARGLWKKLGTDGDAYYQFTRDGKLLTISVSDYTVTDGVLESDALSGTLDIGSDSAFTLRDESGAPSGYVLNRAGDSVAPEEFVTPTPTPVPTPTPSPTPIPTATPSPTPQPTPSPFELAKRQAPSLAPLGDASFAREKVLNVYSAPDKQAYRASGAKVATNEKALIYGVTDGWVLVSYQINNGARGRVGYVEATTLNEPESVAQLAFVSIPLKLTKDAQLTDDPLVARGEITRLETGDEVTLLAFLGDEWAYVETEYKGKKCRLFIPQPALMEE